MRRRNIILLGLLAIVFLLSVSFSLAAPIPVCADAYDNVYGDGAKLGECLVCRCFVDKCYWEPQDGEVDCHTCTPTYDLLVSSDRPVGSLKADPAACFASHLSFDRSCLDIPSPISGEYYCGRSDTCANVDLRGKCTPGSADGILAQFSNSQNDACLDGCYNDDNKVYSNDACFETDDGDGVSQLYCDGTNLDPTYLGANSVDRDTSEAVCHQSGNNCDTFVWGAYGENPRVGQTDYIRPHFLAPLELGCCGDDLDEVPSYSAYAQADEVKTRFPDGAACCSSADMCFGPLATATLGEQADYDDWQCHETGIDGTPEEICQWYDTYPNRIYYDADCDGLLPAYDTDDCGAMVRGYVYRVVRSVGVLQPLAGATVYIEGTSLSNVTAADGSYVLYNVFPTDPDSNATRVIAEFSGLVPDIFTGYISFNAQITHNFTLYDRDCQPDCSNNGICDRTCEGENGCSFNNAVDILGIPAEDITDPGDGIGFAQSSLRYYLGIDGTVCKYLLSCDGNKVEEVKCEDLNPTVDAGNLGILQLGARWQGEKVDAYLATWPGTD